jgi:hypothetical protein
MSRAKLRIAWIWRLRSRATSTTQWHLIQVGLFLQVFDTRSLINPSDSDTRQSLRTRTSWTHLALAWDGHDNLTNIFKFGLELPRLHKNLARRSTRTQPSWKCICSLFEQRIVIQRIYLLFLRPAREKDLMMGAVSKVRRMILLFLDFVVLSSTIFLGFIVFGCWECESSAVRRPVPFGICHFSIFLGLFYRFWNEAGRSQRLKALGHKEVNNDT